MASEVKVYIPWEQSHNFPTPGSTEDLNSPNWWLDIAIGEAGIIECYDFPYTKEKYKFNV